jgi:nucleoside 2-deoxyribosyltransferase
MDKKKCFIITPIGNDTDPIRRHVEGIIDAAVKPALDTEYEIRVAHRICTPGTITRQIISEIYSADLVIANLTGRNPNVMYELAFRHCLGSPMITIAEADTILPSDIISERTIFYHNDAKGVLELREELSKTVLELNFEEKNSPIYDVLKEIASTDEIIAKSESKPQELSELQYIIKRLDGLESLLARNNKQYPRHRRTIRIVFYYKDISKEYKSFSRELAENLSLSGIYFDSVEHSSGKVIINTEIDPDTNLRMVRKKIANILIEMGVEIISKPNELDDADSLDDIIP